MRDTNPKTFRSNRGFSLLELLVILAILAIITAIAIPQMVSQRRLMRSAAVAREIMAQMRNARQLSMSERQSVTFRYDDTTKLITIINHHNNHGLVDPAFAPTCVVGRKEILVAAGYPNTACSRVASTYALNQGGLPASEITYGAPPGVSTGPLGDTISMTPLIPAVVGGKLDITFQNDGSVIDGTGLPLNRAMFFYNNKAAQATAAAISVVGASGRLKVWRYQINGDIFVE
jgi:prepilin-type N-terminal cleavage/methylation domain-containing protein